MTDIERKELIKHARRIWKSQGAKQAVIEDKAEYVVMRLSGFILHSGRLVSTIEHDVLYEVAKEAQDV